MNKKTIYKYFDLIIKILIGGFAFVFIAVKIESHFTKYPQRLNLDLINYKLIIFALAIMLFNWGVESYKWKWLIRKYIKISFFKAFSLVLSGITISIITPNRVGEIPGRVFLLGNSEHRGNLIWLTSLGAFSQLIITVLVGTLAFYLTSSYFIINFIDNLSLLLYTGAFILLLLFIFYQKLPELLYKVPFFNKFESKNSYLSFLEMLKLLCLSGLRYTIFCIQFWLVLRAFQIELSGNELLFMPVYFFITSIIPTMFLSELGVRSSVAVFVFGMITNNIIAIIFASLTLWLLNIAIPALFGIINIRKLKILNK